MSSKATAKGQRKRGIFLILWVVLFTSGLITAVYLINRPSTEFDVRSQAASPKEISYDVTAIQESTNQLSKAEMINLANNYGCFWLDFVEGPAPHGNVRAHLDDEFIPLLKRSKCRFLHASIGTWSKPPDFNEIQTNIRRIREATGVEYVYEMVIAEAIPKTYDSNFGVEYQDFDFAQMCSDWQPVDYGSKNCIPSFEKREYKRYLKYITSKAIDSGVRSFLFGQVYFQDPGWGKNPVVQEVIKSMRAYARRKRVEIVIGAQTNHIESRDYLSNFDYIQGGIFFDNDEAVVGYEDKCSKGREPNSIWGNCTAHLWHKDFRNKAKNVLIVLDLESAVWDDIHRFARLTKSERAEKLEEIHAKMKSLGVSFQMPFLINLSTHLEGTECSGLYPWIYSPTKNEYGSSHRDQYTIHPYTCEDEEAINSLF